MIYRLHQVRDILSEKTDEYIILQHYKQTFKQKNHLTLCLDNLVIVMVQMNHYLQILSILNCLNILRLEKHNSNEMASELIYLWKQKRTHGKCLLSYLPTQESHHLIAMRKQCITIHVYNHASFVTLKMFNEVSKD